MDANEELLDLGDDELAKIEKIEKILKYQTDDVTRRFTNKF